MRRGSFEFERGFGRGVRIVFYYRVVSWGRGSILLFVGLFRFGGSVYSVGSFFREF